jgi:hypothetical protein
LEKIPQANPKETNEVSQTVQGSQASDATGLGAIVITTRLLSVKPNKVHQVFCQKVPMEPLNDNHN